MLHKPFPNLENKKDSFRNKLFLFSKEKKAEKKYNTPLKTLSNEYQKKDDSDENCILNKKCPFYKKYIKLKNEMASFISSREKLKSINQSLYLALSEKNMIYREVKEENNYLKGVIYKLTGIKYSEISSNETLLNIYKNNNIRVNTIPNRKPNKTFNPYYTNTESNKVDKNYQKIKINLKKNPKINSRNTIINNPLMISSSSINKNNLKKSSKYYNKNSIIKNKNSNNSFDSLNVSKSYEEDAKYYNKNPKKGIRAKTTKIFMEFTKKKLLDMDCNANNYYEMINNYTKKQKLKINAKETNSSYLSLDIDLMNLLNNNITLNKLEILTKYDEEFIRECQTGRNDTLFKYCDLISSLIVDYKEIIKLSTRMKDIIKGSILLIDSIISNDSSKKFIEITCQILKCDRASLFLFDKISDKLILYTGEGMKKAQIKVDKNKGIVGACFAECRVLRIEDAYLEERFNKEIDKKTNYRTKSILCYPLIDKEGECFGVIEAINKKNSVFTDDDQELLKLLSQEASSIFKSINYNDNNKYLVNKLFLIVDYSIKINYIKNKYEFSKITEETLLNLFSCMDAAVFFIENNYIIRYFKEDESQKYDMNFGIVGKVIRFKEIIGYKNIKYSEEYNSIIDIKSFDGLLTFPILKRKTKEVCMVIQVPYFGDINKFGKPKEGEMKIIKKFSKCIKNWVFQNEQ